MKHQNVSYITVGGFTLAMLIGLMIMLVQITGYVSGDKYTVYYTEITGLSRGAPVTFQGFKIGRVSAIEAEPKDGLIRYKATLEIERTNGEIWPIPVDSTARLVSSGLLATISVDIKQGSKTEMFKPGDTIDGQEAVSIFAALESIGQDIDQYKDNISTILARIDRTTETVEQEMPAILASVKSGSTKLDQGIENIVAEVTKVTAVLEAGAKDMREIVGSTNRESIGNFLESMEQGAANFESLSAELQGSKEKLDLLLDDSQAIVGDSKPEIRNTLKNLRAAIEIISQRIGGITHNLDVTSRNMAEFSRQIRENPGLLIRGTNPREAAP
jgi:phospholipid/cholesterol/gamma-HCH transport system substrate-binding protein